METMLMSHRFELRPDVYVLGHAPAELKRLDAQADLLRNPTRRWLRDAGLRPGMRVLDVGCGTGDVTLMAAELVGPSGYVAGVDRAAAPLEIARAIATARGFLGVEYLEDDIQTMQPDGLFDAVVGRFVLFHQSDPVATLRHLRQFVRPGGIIAFADYHLMTPISQPIHPLCTQAYRWLTEAMRRAGLQADIGMRLQRMFQAAGLPTPALEHHQIASVSADPRVVALLADTIRTSRPFIEGFGVATAAEIEIDTLSDRLYEEAKRLDGVFYGPLYCTAFTRTPRPTHRPDCYLHHSVAS